VTPFSLTKGRPRAWGLLFAIHIMLISVFFIRAGTWNFNGYIQYAQGKYTTSTNISGYYFSGGLGYQSGPWYVSASIPYIFQNSNQVSKSGGIIIPSGHMPRGDGSSQHQGGHMTEPAVSTTDEQFISGFGDTYCYGSYQILNEASSHPAVLLAAQLKIPTAADEFGTGKFDYGASAGLFKMFNNYSVFTDIGFWTIGDTDSTNYFNPVTFGAGLGRIFNHGKYAAMLYLQAYTRIIEGYDPPRQLSLTVSRFLKQNLFLSITGTTGLSETSSDFTLSAGINARL
jgi:hypothetical protein